MSTSYPWSIETIPDGDWLFYRVPVGWLKPNKKPHPGVFQQRGNAMSADWNKYSTGEETRSRSPNPARFAVLKMSVDCVRSIRGMSVLHDPIYAPNDDPPNVNRAHCAIYGLEASSEINEIGYEERVRLSLLECSGEMWEIPPGTP
jgi:hypothetical protein